MNEYKSELKTLWSAVFHPFLIVFYILELMVLFLFYELDLSFMPESLIRVEFAKRIGESTNFPDKAYIFSLIMMISLLSSCNFFLFFDMSSSNFSFFKFVSS